MCVYKLQEFDTKQWSLLVFFRELRSDIVPFYTPLHFLIFLELASDTKVCLVKAMVFPVVMYGCESWSIKKAQHWRIDAFELWCWRRLLRVPWTARRSSWSILKEILMNIYWKDWRWSFSWSWNSNTWPHDVKNWLVWKDPDAGKDCKREEKEMTEDEMAGWHHRLNGHEFE